MDNKISYLKNLVLILVIAISFYGFLKYIDERFAIYEIHNALLEQKLSFLEQKEKTDIEKIKKDFLGNQSSLVSLLENEQANNTSLKEQFDSIKSNLTTLNKLSATDKELLKKYSKNYFLNEHYLPISLTPIEKNYVNNSSANFQIHSNVLPYLQAMLISANNEGMEILVQSAYRSFLDQSSLKSNYKVIYGAGTANRFSADQGYSEHQLGTTIDFTTKKLNGTLSGFDKSSEYEWLVNNAYRFGFILSYPKGNKYYIYEPWHWRFVGIQLATRLHDDGVFFYDLDQRIIDSYLSSIFD